MRAFHSNHLYMYVINNLFTYTNEVSCEHISTGHILCIVGMVDGRGYNSQLTPMLCKFLDNMQFTVFPDTDTDSCVP